MPVVPVYMRAAQTRLPCGCTDTGELLERLWISTGADCDGEEEQLPCGCGCGQTHALKLVDADAPAAAA